MAKMSLAQALTLRKELNQKVADLKHFDQRDLFEVKAERRKVTDSLEDVIAKVPKVPWEKFTYARDHVSRSLREIDNVIQRANHETEVDVPDLVLRSPEQQEAFVDKNLAN